MHQEHTDSAWIEDMQFDWTDLMSCANALEVKRETHLFHQSDPIRSIYVVDEGRVRLSLTSATGDEKTFVIVGRNGVVGEMGLFDTNEHITSAIASSDARLLVFDAQVFADLVTKHPALARHLFANVSRKFRILSTQTLDLSYTSAQYRVVKSLWELAQTYGVPAGPGIRIGIRFTQQEMANLAGVTRVTVAQVLRTLERNGILQKDHGYVFINSISQIHNLLQDPKVSHFKSMMERTSIQ